MSGGNNKPVNEPKIKTITLTVPDRTAMYVRKIQILGTPLENVEVRGAHLATLVRRLASYDINCMNLVQDAHALKMAEALDAVDDEEAIVKEKKITVTREKLMKCLELVRQVTTESMADVLPRPAPPVEKVQEKNKE